MTNRLNETQIHQVLPYVYLGGSHRVEDRKYLDELKIRTILNMIKYSPTCYFLKPYYKYYHIGWDDDPRQEIIDDLYLIARPKLKLWSYLELFIGMSTRIGIS